MKPLRQQIREAVAIAGCTVLWTSFAVVSFDRMPHAWFRAAGASFAPVTGGDIAYWALPAALAVLFIGGWMATLGLIFQVFRWHIRDDDRPDEAALAGPDAHDEPLGH